MSDDLEGEWFALELRGKGGIRYVLPALIIEVPHLSRWKFALHKSIDPTTGWNVSEVSSGLAVLREELQAMDPDEAIDNALEVLALVTPEKFAETYARDVKQELNS